MPAGPNTFRWSERRSDFCALLLSGVLAAVAPLQTLLLAYAVLGPLHYLTEIAWLRTKKFYFGTGLVPSGVYVALAGAMALFAAFSFLTHRSYSVAIVVGLLLLSLTVWIRSPYVLAALFIALLAARKLSPGSMFLLSVLVPTLIHVFAFTWVFMVSGAMRAKARGPLRWLNPALLLIIPAVLVLALRQFPAPAGALSLRALAASFGGLIEMFARSFRHAALPTGASPLSDPIIVAILRGFGFVYLFHYLNWFSKVELLAWHRVPARVWTIIVTLWAISVSMYAWNFRIGFMVANFLSLLHVLLEFPLNWTSIRFVLRGGRPDHAPTAALRAESNAA